MRSCRTLIMGLLFPIAMLLICGCGSAPLTTKVLDKEGLLKSNAVTILDFSGKSTSVRYSGNTDSLGHVMATLLQKELQKRSTTLDVRLDSGHPVDIGLVLEGEFTKIDEGDAGARIMLGPLAGGVGVAVEGKIRKPSGETVAEFSKEKETSGGLLGMGGWTAGESDEIISDIMSEIAEDLADFILESRE